MQKTEFEHNFLDSLNRNFDKYANYLEFNYQVFFELRPLVFQVTKCLILELDFATITLTNNILERLLKLALISKSVGIRPIPTESWNLVFDIADKKYGTISLGNAIELCKKENLITDVQKDVLFDTVRELMRNGFSHADASKVLKNLPNEMSLYQFSFSNASDLKEVKLNPKTVTPLQSIQIENFAKINGANYFDYVFKLIDKIEQKLVEMDKE